MHKEVTPPRSVNRRIPIDLETICLKAMDRDPDRRYQTAGEMAGDLRRFVNRYAISARRAGPVHRMVKWVRRHPAVSLLLSLLLLASVTLGIFAAKIHDERTDRIAGLKEQILFEALSGDFVQAEGNLEKARQLGVPEGWIRLIRGVVGLLQGEYRNAGIEIDRAEPLLEGSSTAAYAMRTLAYEEEGDEDNHLKRLVGLEELPAPDFADLLFEGWAEVRFLPERAVANLRKARELRPTSHVASMLYATALWYDAAARGDIRTGLDEADEAIHVLESVRILVESPRVFSELVLAHIVASDRHRELGEPAKSREYLERVGKYVDRLADWPQSVDARWARVMYFYRTDDRRALLADFAEDLEQGRRIRTYEAIVCASIYFRDKNRIKALEAFARAEAGPTRVAEFARAYVEMEHIDPTELAKQYFDGVMSRRKDASHILRVVRLVGRPNLLPSLR